MSAARVVLVRIGKWGDDFLALPAEALPHLAGAYLVEDKDPYGKHDFRVQGSPTTLLLVDAAQVRPEDPAAAAPDPVAAVQPAAPTTLPLTATATDAPGTLHCPPLREFVDEFRHDEVPL